MIDSRLVKVFENDSFAVFIDGFNCFNYHLHCLKGEIFEVRKLLFQFSSFLQGNFILSFFKNLPFEFVSNLIFTEVLEHSQIFIGQVLFY